MELKTLKDLEQTPSDFGGIYSLNPVREDEVLDKDNVATVGDLRAEAVKWIKEMQNSGNKPLLERADFFARYVSEGGSILDLIEDEKHIPFLISWIKMFFNITEEGLK